MENQNQLDRIQDFVESLERVGLDEDQQALLLVGGRDHPITVENNCSCRNASGMGCTAASSNNCECGGPVA